MVSRFQDQTQKGLNLTYSMIHDKAHTNVAFLFAELLRGEPEKDTVAIPRGQIGSFSIFFFVVDDKSVREFVSELTAVNGNDDWLAFAAAYGIRRSSAIFWETADFFDCRERLLGLARSSSR